MWLNDNVKEDSTDDSAETFCSSSISGNTAHSERERPFLCCQKGTCSTCSVCLAIGAKLLLLARSIDFFLSFQHSLLLFSSFQRASRLIYIYIYLFSTRYTRICQVLSSRPGTHFGLKSIGFSFASVLPCRIYINIPCCRRVVLKRHSKWAIVLENRKMKYIGAILSHKKRLTCPIPILKE